MTTKVNPRLIRRLTGQGGKGHLIDALKAQLLVGGDQTLARQIANNVTTREVRADYELIAQGADDNDLYFILSGSCSIEVNGRQIAVRNAGEHVGEVAMLDTMALRSARVRTIERSVVAAISEPKFARVAKQHPLLWRTMALVLGHRLKERNRFHPAPREQPSVFIGSSSDNGLKIAEHISRYLARYPIVPRLWSKGVFECSNTTIEDVMRITDQVDFAVLVLTADDVTSSRGKRKASPRDNVIFELGLFMGALDRTRSYMVIPADVDIKIPTDLLGLNTLRFQQRPGRTLARNLQTVLRPLRSLIEKHGPI
jgi:CRP/FNR family cyclic AMP-dependent transcriptional regulator